MSVVKKFHAVLTGDIVNSSQLQPATEKQLWNTLDKLFDPFLYDYYRGDSFQVYIDAPRMALSIALQCRAIAISFVEEQTSGAYDIRIGIGIGTVDHPVKKLSNAKGEAFLLSGRSLDEISKTNTRLTIATSNELANAGLKILADYVNSIFDQISSRQAQVISRLLAGDTQQKIAEELGKSKSTIHQLTVSGRWAEIKQQLLQFENLIKYLT